MKSVSKLLLRLLVAACLPASAAGIFFGVSALAATPRPADPASTELWYDQPARTWMTEALPIGNGSLGGMIFGLTATERVQFNHNTLWTGDEKDTGRYQAFGDILIQLGHTDVSDYRRALDLDRAVQTVSYRSRGVHYERTAFASHPAGVIVLQFSADQPAAHTGRLWLCDMHEGTVSAEGNRLTVSGRLGRDGLDYEAQLVLLHHGGKVRIESTPLAAASDPLAGVPGGAKLKLPGTYLVFEDCDRLTVVLAAATNYMPDSARKWRGAPPHAAVTRAVNAVTAPSVDRLLNEHVADHQALFHRFALNLGTTAAPLRTQPTPARLLAYTKDRTVDPDLEELFTHYGRYLMIACSRPGGLPANLQGLWNDSNTPPWRSDYHSNINVEMNYWPAEPTGLGELHRPFHDYVTSQIPIARQRTREEPAFAATTRGWTVRTENGIFGGGSFVWNPPGSAWYAQHFWEHYAFSQDREFLAKVAYPVLKELCAFWEEMLVARPDGTLVAPKGWSPEHGPTEPGVSYDQEIIHDLFSNFLDAAHALQVDAPYREKIAGLRARLLWPKVGKWGQLQEWAEDRDDPKNQHRHVSHLFALHPGRQITPTGTPELFEAARVSLVARGDGGTGWSRAWKINFWARLRDGDHAYLMLRNLLTVVNNVGTDMKNGGGVYPNLLDAHPPFQIEGNFGATAGVAEMLLQSRVADTETRAEKPPFAIDLLPALPKAWPNGSVAGLRARGGFVISASWQAGVLTTATLRRTAGATNGDARAEIRYADHRTTVELKPGQSVTLDARLQSLPPSP